jgi:Fungal chitosanase of glycosyl hydrolase group 75
VRKLRSSTWGVLALICAALIFGGIIYRWISLERLQRVVPGVVGPTPTPSPEPSPSATRSQVVSGKLDTAKIFNGITLHATVETPPGADASTERGDPQNYIIELQLKARMPTPNKTIEDLAKVSPQLPTLLPGLGAMLKPDSLSPFFAELYATKTRILRENLGRLDLLLSRHNFYDCQTVLQLRAPENHRRAILIQADMDVDADGSDGDRVPAGHGVSTNFKPFTSYRWPKKTQTENPYLQATEEKMKRFEDEAALKTITAERKKDLRAAISQLREEIGALKKFSYLIGTTDPFIVVPGALAHEKEGPKVGDYAVVIYGDKIYPALVGDIGPNDKVGEASLRIAKEINTLSTPYNRPVSDLKVSYIVFPGTAETPWGPPDLDKIEARCQTLVDEIGGASTPLHHWEDIIPKPTPTPTVTPTPTASPTPSSSPESSTSAMPSPSPAATFAFPISAPKSSQSPNGR